MLAAARRVAVVERVNDHENLGVLFRNAAALGVDAVVLDHESADPLYRRCVRVLDRARVHGAVDAVRRHLADIASRRIHVVALTPAPDAIPISPRYEWPQRCALVRRRRRATACPTPTLAPPDARVRIPMHAGVDSLNVATAARSRSTRRPEETPRCNGEVVVVGCRLG